MVNLEEKIAGTATQGDSTSSWAAAPSILRDLHQNRYIENSNSFEIHEREARKVAVLLQFVDSFLVGTGFINLFNLFPCVHF